MHKENVGYVNEQEKEEILGLFERKMALQELLISLGNQNLDSVEIKPLYEKIVSDFGKTKIQYDNWWNNKSQKYQWKSPQNASWNIDFHTNEIYLLHNN